ncbi:MAG: hypothetical protein GX086_07185 [Alcaligenaceae bacterium]|nr:hypothetical protein [Alcaligenaceae bacterium]
MPIEDYLLMIICLVAVSGLIVFVWERYLSPPLIKKYDGQGAWAKNSSKIPRSSWVWSFVLFMGVFFGPTYAVRLLL